jgi:mannitol/fructose-specific phosphotransferase system IIA component (Ntr-type)
MDLTKLLPVSHLQTELMAMGLQDGLRLAVQPLVDTGIVSDGDKFVEDLIVRESQYTTAVGNFVAIPHARTHTASRLGLAIAVFPGGLDFPEAPDGQPVKVFFIIAIPAFAPVAHMPLLQHIAKFVRNPKKVEKLVDSKSAAAAVKYLLSFKA